MESDEEGISMKQKNTCKSPSNGWGTAPELHVCLATNC